MPTAMNPNAGSVARRWLAVAISVALVIAIICATVPANLVHAPVVSTLISLVSLAVPSLNAIAARSDDYDRYLLVLSSQWLFAPVYAYIFFIRLFPFAASARRAADARLAGMDPSQKPNRLALLFGLVILVLNALGTLGVIHWPSFYNGGYVLDKLSPVYSAFYSSTIGMIVFAWFSSIMEILFAWMLLYSAAHARFLLTGRVREERPSARTE